MNISSLYSKSLALAIAALSFSSALACTCFYAGTFEVFAKQHPIIVRGVVESYGAELPTNAGFFKTMKVSVSDTIKGSFSHSTFEFFGDTGMSCLRYITRQDFPIGSEHFFLLEDDDTSQPLMSCGEASVAIHGDSIRGNVIGENEYIDYEMGVEEFIKKVR